MIAVLAAALHLALYGTRPGGAALQGRLPGPDMSLLFAGFLAAYMAARFALRKLALLRAPSGGATPLQTGAAALLPTAFLPWRFLGAARGRSPALLPGRPDRPRRRGVRGARARRPLRRMPRRQESLQGAGRLHEVPQEGSEVG
ncbi:MAG: hypothetical protein HY748_10830 [Elusimicrobia bacterium]|nr:hypothetical protein [Elusimicrobiota bacterium]